MGSLIQPSRLNRQPQQAFQIDWGNPITRGLISVFTGPLVYDPVTGKPNGNAAPNNRVATPMGVALNAAVGQAKINVAGPSISNGSMLLLATSMDASAEQIMLEIGPDGSFTAGVRGIRLAGGKITTYVRNFFDLTSAGSYTAGTPFVVGVTYAGDATSLYWNGALSSAGTTANSNEAAAIFNVGGITGQTAYNLNGTVPLAAAWSRTLSAAEMASLSANPWQIFKSPARKISVSAPISISGNATIAGTSSTASAGNISAASGATANTTGASATSAPGSVSASGTASANITGASATYATSTLAGSGAAAAQLTGASASARGGQMQAGGAATANLPSAPATAQTGAISAVAGGSANATIIGAAASVQAGTVTASGGASVTTGSLSSTVVAGVFAASGAAKAGLAGAEVAMNVGSVSADGESSRPDASVRVEGVEMAASAGLIAAAGTRTRIEVSVTEDMICAAVRSYILSIAPNLRIIRTPVNRASMPNGPYVSFTPGLRRPLSTNVSTSSDNARFVKRSEQMTFQIDCYGEGSSDLAETLNTLYRDPYAVELFAQAAFEIVPLYAGEIMQAPFVNDADQYEDRYLFQIELQVNSVIAVPQQSCNILGIDIKPVTATFPPNEVE